MKNSEIADRLPNLLDLSSWAKPHTIVSGLITSIRAEGKNDAIPLSQVLDVLTLGESDGWIESRLQQGLGSLAGFAGKAYYEFRLCGAGKPGKQAVTRTEEIGWGKMFSDRR